MLELSSVSFSFENKQVLKDFSLTVNNGETVVLKGPSGCGKTTAAMLLCGLLKTVSGRVTAPEKISVVFQEDRFIDNLSLIRNIRLPLKKADYSFADSLLEEVGLKEERSKKIAELSGGMKRRAALVRAVAFDGDALILDEAFNGMDNANKQICADIIKRHFIEKNKPVLLITHIDEDAALLEAKTVYMAKPDDAG